MAGSSPAMTAEAVTSGVIELRTVAVILRSAIEWTLVMPVGEYVSPDGQLKFLITCPDGDWTIGFDGFPWHTHGSILAALSGQDEIAAVERFLADLIGNVSVIALTRISGELTSVWVTDDPQEALSDCRKYGQADETVEFRLWNGTRVDI